MVITNHFVFIHNPKTGGTFCETHIERLYNQTNRQRLGNLARGKMPLWCKNTRRHRGLHAVPRYARHLPLLATIRNPYDRWVSQYEYQVYRMFPDVIPKIDQVKAAYPHFPDVTFTEYIDVINGYWNKVQNEVAMPFEDRIGYYSAQFIGLFCPNPIEILCLPKDEITADLVRSKMVKNITFLETADLNQQLYDYLSRFNHDQDDLVAILESPKILPVKSGPGSLRKKEAWKGYYTSEAVEKINDREKLIFDLFPHYKRLSYDESWKAYERPHKYQTPLDPEMIKKFNK